ncbi:uncharacterized protein AMSG_03872 [Thecamonas trahens ATCC 50062]|uniref:TLC domain-containing protein n=1 Tax=Thecamonas trahens ATCC 50062 TaxID=461836 RepID=A0A0L0D6F1_THETB|nr:hypothetical protein AMSG_03872 [Thecamonas trahens ATCC 50062]KNC47641.1 hypothetical protein AMSG_03872 [Thecamonas trahens ATCC 50062]|eukprot:XP_013759125.1 hypothetical protein AMSG_03872 [Thecamonas trahens ATCC 50062]
MEVLWELVKPMPSNMGTPNVTDDVLLGLAFMVVIAFADFVLLRNVFKFMVDDKNGRYFTLHVAINAYVVLVHFDDVYYAITDPWGSVFWPCDNRGIIAIAALHLYHIGFYQPLPAVDWVHHIIMIIILLPTAYLLQPGPMLGEGAFWASGLPGGIDYLMLVLVKAGKMNSLTEKSWNTTIQTWIRMPGCLYHAFVSWAALMRLVGMPYDPASPRLPYALLPDHMLPITICLMITVVGFFWNGPYFAARVVASHAVHTERKKLAAKAK